MGVRTRLLVISPWFKPGFKAGGVVRAVVNMVDAVADQLDVSIVTSDRDLLDSQPYPGVEVDRWLPCGAYRVFYLSPGPAAFARMTRLVRDERWDTIHINGVFDPLYNLLPVLVVRAMPRSRRPRLIVQVHGMFGAGALRIKAPKKRLFLAASRALSFHRDVLWHASTALEADEVRAVFGQRAQVAEATNVPDPPRAQPPEPRDKSPGQARLCFFSRVTPKKGLLEAVRFLARSSAGAGVSFDIIGPIDDAGYWRSCEREIERLRGRVGIELVGAIEPSEVHEALSRYHFLLLPTQHENFGYVILEALLAGCPVILSDQTPWRDIEERQVGWTLPLDEPAVFVRVIDECIAMDAAEYRRRSLDAHRYAVERASDPATLVPLVALLTGR